MLEIKNKFKKNQNELDSIDEDEQRDILEKKLASYEKIYKLLKKNYSNENLLYELERTKNELNILKGKKII